MRAIRFILLSSAIIGCLSADVIYDNTGAQTDSIDNYSAMYDSFTATTNSRITDLQLVFLGTANVGLYADSSTTPGTLIASLRTVSNNCYPYQPGSYPYICEVSLPKTTPLLTADTRYWIGVSANNGAGWAWTGEWGGDVGVAGEYFSNPNGTFPNGTPYQMSVTTTAVSTVPEPSAALFALLGCGLLCLSLQTRRHRLQQKIHAGVGGQRTHAANSQNLAG